MIFNIDFMSLADLFSSDNIWILIMGYSVGASCGLLGNYLVLKRMAFMGDAISHSVLPGIVIAFIILKQNSSLGLLIGALMAAGFTTYIIHIIQLQKRIKSDTAIGITFSTLFAVGIVLIALFADKVDLDQDCVLYGEIGFIHCHPCLKIGSWLSIPIPIIRMISILVASILFVCLCYKQLLIIAFDSTLASVMGIRVHLINSIFMIFVSLSIVASFESVGAILVVGMIVFPGVTASLCTQKLKNILIISLILPAIYSIGGLYLAYGLDTSISSSMIVVAAGVFGFVWTIYMLKQNVYRVLNPAKNLDI